MPLDLKKDDMGDVIKDFYKSKAPQFKGKSKKKRREMAIAAKLSAERGPLPEVTKYDRYDKEKRKHAADDKRMKFGKFVDKAKQAKSRLRPGEVKRYDKNLGRYVSNKE